MLHDPIYIKDAEKANRESTLESAVVADGNGKGVQVRVTSLWGGGCWKCSKNRLFLSLNDNAKIKKLVDLYAKNR